MYAAKAPSSGAARHLLPLRRAKGTPGYAPRDRSASMISRSVGNRPCSFFENSVTLSTDTSKMPPLPRTICDS
jgi:hypothetical protein